MQLEVAQADSPVMRAIAISTMGTLFARDLVNRPVIDLTATQLAHEAREAGKRHGFSVEVLEKNKLKA